MRKFTCTIEKEDEGLGIRRMLKRHFDFSSRLFAKLRHQGLVFLNGEKLEGYMKPKEGDTVTCVMPDEVSRFEPEDIPFDVIYEDEDILVIDKPAGYTVHPTKGHPSHTMANGIMKYMLDSGEKYKIRFVNRLDMDTTGLLIVGKNSNAQDMLIRDMDNGKVDKRYLAVCVGVMDKDEFKVDLPIGQPEKDKVGRSVVPEGEGRPSVTNVKVLERISPSASYESGFTLVELRLETGRTHQIRVHLSHIGHPLAGDPLYGDGDPSLIARQALHAYKLSFRHPVTKKEMGFEAPIPEDMSKLLAKIRG